MKSIPHITVIIMLLAALAVPLASAQLGTDYIDEAPPTVYEAQGMNPQNMDFDAQNNLFRAHPGWLNDKEVFYYKFRMYTPSTYPETVPMGHTSPTIPIGPLYILTTTGDLSGLVPSQRPIIWYHHDDGEDYSDFLRVHFVTVSPTYEADTYRSYGDLVAAGADIVPSDIYVNAPLAPTGSRLEHPTSSGTAPIDPVMAWYRGVEVQLFFFETTSQAFTDTYNPMTRPGSTSMPGSGFEMTVSPGMMSGAAVRWEPIWHVNQYGRGVQEGVNGGGPNPAGQRNVIGVDRLDATYSPLWQVWWATQVPVGYVANQASHPEQFTEANGFKIARTPMFVNCPNVGPHGGGAPNADKVESFAAPAAVDGDVEVDGALVMQADRQVTAYIDGKSVATSRSGMMGGYSLMIPERAMGSGENLIEVRDPDGNVVATFTVMKKTSVVPGPGAAPMIALVVLVVLGVAALRRRGA